MKVGDKVLISPYLTKLTQWISGTVIEVEDNPFKGIVISAETEDKDVYFGQEDLFKIEKDSESDSLKQLLDKLRNGQWVLAGAKDSPEISSMLIRCADMCFDINNMRPSLQGERQKAFKMLLGDIGENFVIHSPFHCDFGFNIKIGKNFIGNFNLTILDEAEVIIGDNVMIGPNCSLITITHAMLSQQRNAGLMAARSIKICNNVWIASNVVILPGVEIGEGSVIGAGSVVTKSIPPYTLAVGNPCRPIRPLESDDLIAL